MSDAPDARSLLAAAPVSVGLSFDPPASLAALPCLLPSFPGRHAGRGGE